MEDAPSSAPDLSSGPAAAALSLDRGDLEKVLALLALAADRGAFQIQEFRDVGGLWEKLSAFLQAAKP